MGKKSTKIFIKGSVFGIFWVIDMRKQLEKEKGIILFSIAMTVLSSILGISIGIIANSQLILFDGVYSLVSFALSLTSLYTAKFMAKNDWKRYPFGKAAAEPLVMIFNYTALIFLAAQFIFNNIKTLLEGGREVRTGIALIYAVITTSICGGTYLIINRFARDRKSGLLQVEADGWLYDTYTSLSVLLTFLVVRVFANHGIFTHYLRFVDPAVVILFSVMFIRWSVKMIIEASKEILAVSADDELTDKLEEVVGQIEKDYRIKESFVRVSKGRRVIWVEIDFVVDDHSLVKTVKDEDEIRAKIYDALKMAKCDKWVTISFTTKRKWAK
uniref:Cation efflux protein transmembrane domain-containing protein n=1 Tax=Fervidobacterium thailandense TaxID=1008305 RepID=A0A7C4GMB9_9BACT